MAPQLKKLCTSCSRDAVEPALRASAIDIGEIARGAGSLQRLYRDLCRLRGLLRVNLDQASNLVEFTRDVAKVRLPLEPVLHLCLIHRIV